MTKKELIESIKNRLDFLLTHNKNYTKIQYYELDSIEEEFEQLAKIISLETKER